MIFKSFLLGNPVSLCVKIMNSVVVVGLYYGFLTTFSIGPSYLFLLRARVMEEKEGTEKLVSATAGFILGQLMMFLSIYYAPLHLALDRPHTITVLVLPYLLFHYFCHKEIQFFEYTNRNRNSIRKFSIRRVFLNNLIFQLFNQFLLPSSTLARLVNVSMFRCNNKMLFVTSSFVGWLIGHIFFMKWVGLILFWIRKMMNSIRPKIMNSIRSKKDIRFFFYKYYAYKLFIFSKNELFFMILLITNIYYLGRIPTPALTRGLPESALMEEWERGKNEKGQKFLFWFEHHLVTILFDYKLWNRPLRYIKNNNFEKPVMDEMSEYFFRICPGYGKQIISLTHPPSLSTFLKMMQRKVEHWSRKRKRKQPRDLSSDLVSINRKKRGNARLELIDRIRALAKGALVLDVLEKRTRVCDEDEDENKEKEDENKEKEDENKEKEDENKEKYLPKVLDPFLCGPYRQKGKGHTFIHSQKKEERWLKLNKIVCGTLIVDLPGLCEPKRKDQVLEFFRKLEASRRRKVEVIYNQAYNVISSNIVGPEVDDPECLENLKESREIGKETIRTKVPRWSHYLNTDLQEEETEIADEPTEDYYPVLLRGYNRLLVYSEDDENIDTNASIGIGGQLEEQDNEVAMLQYKTEETDDLRGLIKGSTSAQRRKAVFLSPYQINIQSPLFLDRTDRKFFLFFDISKIIDTYKKVKKIFSNGAGKGPEFEVSTSDFKSDLKREKNKELQELVKQYLSSSSRKNEKRSRKAIKKKWKEILSIEKLKEESIEKLKKESEKTGKKKKEQESEKFDEFLELGLWDVVLAVQGSRGLVLVAQSIFRKYILLPSIVIAKNLVRMLLLQTPEWSADWKDWKKEGHIKCTYSGVELSDTEFPSNWLTEGIQIKVVFPFYPKPWRRSKLRSRHRDPMKEKKRNADWENKRKRKRKHSFYLTAWGGATDRPFGRPQKIPSFFQPIWKELQKRIRKEKNKPFSFSVLIRALISSLIKRFPFLWTILGILEDKTRWIQNQKITPFIFIKIKEKIKEFAKKNSIFRKPNREIKRRVSQSQLQMPQKNLTRMVSTRRSRGGVKVFKRTVPRRNRYNNRMTFRFNPPATATNLTHSQIQMRILDIEKSRILGEIRKLEEKILDLIPDENISETGLDNISKTGLDAEKWEIWLWLYISELWLFFGDMLRIIGALLIRKLHLIICLFIERIYMDIFLCTINISFLCTINICRIHAQPFFESKRKMINKYIENIEKRIDETNQKNAIDFDFISTLKESHSTNSNSSNDNEKSQTSWDLSSLSQAYVFYNLSQTQVINKYHLRSVLQDRGAHLFFKDRIKDFLRTLGILDAKSSPKRLPNSGMNEWKNWLRGHYRYNFSQTRGSELVPEKRRNKVSQEKRKKNYRYGLLSHKYIHYADKADKKDSYTFIDIEDALEKESITIIDMFAENAGRKYADWRAWGNLLGFYEEVRRKKKKKNIDSETPTNRDTGTDINEKRNPSNPKSISDRIGDLSRSRRKRRRMSMERKLLLFNYVNYEGISENQKGKEEPGQKGKEEPGQKGKEEPGQKNLGSDPQNQQKDLEKDSAESDINKKRGKQFKKKKKKKKNMNQAELKLFLRKHLLSQLYLNLFLDRPMMTSVRAYCFLLKTLNDSRDIAIYFVRTRDIRMGIMEELQHSMDPSLNVPELIKGGIMTIHPIRLFRKLDGQSIMYQTINTILLPEKEDRAEKEKKYQRIGISVVYNKEKKHQTNQRCREKKYDLLGLDNLPSTRRRREYRIRFCFDCEVWKFLDSDPVLVDEVNMRDCVYFLDENKHIDTDRNKLIQFKLFLWPNYRLEDLACMNRYWFYTNNGSRFSMSRIHMYPRFRIS